jgi:hypothetical protein
MLKLPIEFTFFYLTNLYSNYLAFFRLMCRAIWAIALNRNMFDRLRFFMNDLTAENAENTEKEQREMNDSDVNRFDINSISKR